MNMDDLGVPFFLETPIYTHIIIHILTIVIYIYISAVIISNHCILCIYIYVKILGMIYLPSGKQT